MSRIKKTLHILIAFIFLTIGIVSCERNNEPSLPKFMMTFTTTKSVGGTIVLGIDAEKEDQADVWIDLNNNGTRDGNENTLFLSTDFSSALYVVKDKKITIHGKVNCFYCGTNKIVSIDLSKNPYLVEFYCEDNQLENLDVSNNAQLKVLNCNMNYILTLDVSKNHKLTTLVCGKNKLSALNLGQVPIGKLLCDDNQLQSLDISKNIELRELKCQSNKIKTLDFSQNPALEFVVCCNNLINASALTTIMKSLPQRLSTKKGDVFVYMAPDLNAVPNISDIVIANGKNWVIYANNNVMQP